MKILFQGDSITDAGRSRENDRHMGMGYPSIVSEKLDLKYPDEYEFINRGISGNRISDLVARMKVDMINLRPDVMSILIGVNDVWHEIDETNGVNTPLFEKLYDILIEEVKAELPEIRIMVMEPFLTEGTVTARCFEQFRAEVEQKAQAAKRISQKHGLEFIELQKVFDEAVMTAPEICWTEDGMHPSEAGHELIAKEWIKAFFLEV